MASSSKSLGSESNSSSSSSSDSSESESEAAEQAAAQVSSFTTNNDAEIATQQTIVEAALSGPAISGAIATAETEIGTVQVSATGVTVTVDFNKSTLFYGGKGIKFIPGASAGSRTMKLRRNAINQGVKNNSNGDNPAQFVTFSIMRNSLRRVRGSGGGKQKVKQP